MAQIEDHLKRHARILCNAEATFIITVEQARPVAVMLQAAVPSLAAIITPSSDPYTMLAMTVPMWLFYEAAIIIGRLMKK